MGKIISNILITLLVLCFVNFESIANAFHTKDDLKKTDNHTNDGLKKTDNLKETEVIFILACLISAIINKVLVC